MSILVLETFACRGQRLLHFSTVGQMLSINFSLALKESGWGFAGSTSSAASWRCCPTTRAACSPGAQPSGSQSLSGWFFLH